MQNIRFINPNELHHVKTMFSISKNLVGEETYNYILKIIENEPKTVSDAEETN
jgi:hypothetical protein